LKIENQHYFFFCLFVYIQFTNTITWKNSKVGLFTHWAVTFRSAGGSKRLFPVIRLHAHEEAVDMFLWYVIKHVSLLVTATEFDPW